MPLVTPHGDALAHWRLERGIEMPTSYECLIITGPHAGEIWEFPQTVLRAQTNITAGRLLATAG
jgi:hypothetical protein